MTHKSECIGLRKPTAFLIYSPILRGYNVLFCVVIPPSCSIHSDTQPVAASALTLLEATTQTDPEPSAEFEAESMKVTTDGELETNCRTPELNVSEVNMVAISPVPSSTENITNEDLKAEVDRYKTALNMTESVLADLQNSVDEEAERWRKALDASRMECEVVCAVIALYKFFL